MAILIGAFSLRVKAIFFAMITLAFAEFALILAVQWTPLTGGEDGLSPRLPGVFAVGLGRRAAPRRPAERARSVTYYAVLAVCLALFLLMRRFVHSPLGRTLQAIRDNELRAEALGYRTFVFQLAASSFGERGRDACSAGCYAMWVRYVNPESALGIPIMLDVLLMVIIGGIGTLYGGIVGAAVLLTARTLLPDLRGARRRPRARAPRSFSGSRTGGSSYFGILFILVVFFFPKGVLGTLREARSRQASEPARPPIRT